MVRTRADGGSSSASTRKVVAARAPRKVLGGTSSSSASVGDSPSGKGGKYAGGNAACPRPTPDWQKGIGSFLQKNDSGNENSGKENSEPTKDDDDIQICEEPGASSSSADS